MENTASVSQKFCELESFLNSTATSKTIKANCILLIDETVKMVEIHRTSNLINRCLTAVNRHMSKKETIGYFQYVNVFAYQESSGMFGGSMLKKNFKASDVMTFVQWRKAKKEENKKSDADKIIEICVKDTCTLTAEQVTKILEILSPNRGIF